MLISHSFGGELTPQSCELTSPAKLTVTNLLKLLVTGCKMIFNFFFEMGPFSGGHSLHFSAGGIISSKSGAGGESFSESTQ